MRKAVTMLSTSVRHYERYHLDVNIRVAEHTTQSCLFPFRGLTAAWFFGLAKESQLLLPTKGKDQRCICGEMNRIWIHHCLILTRNTPSYITNPLQTTAVETLRGFSNTDRDADSSTDAFRLSQVHLGGTEAHN